MCLVVKVDFFIFIFLTVPYFFTSQVIAYKIIFGSCLKPHQSYTLPFDGQCMQQCTKRTIIV
jgi:hypothetical protein